MADQQELSIAQQLKKVIEETNSTLDKRIEKQEDIIDKYVKAVERLKQMAQTEENIDNIKQVQIQKTKIEQCELGSYKQCTNNKKLDTNYLW